MATIEIPFGAKDSELMGWEYTIPEDMEAVIKDGKVVVRKKENKDERIIKNLQTCLHCGKTHGMVNNDEYLVCKNYLEKQKEQKPTECTPDSALQKIKRAMTDCKKLSEHYKDTKENFYQYYGGKAEGLQLALTYFGNENELTEQKPAEWDFPYGVNETVDKLIAIAECLEMDGDCLFNGYSGTECGKFLRDLARKEVECKPAEWNEGDLKKITEMLFCFRTMVYPSSEKCDEFIEFLKSLTMRCPKKSDTWKPSEEQMNALWNTLHPDDPYYVDLSSLYDDLKKLL